jgi:Hypervirulence associated proteins TUDOR domain
MAKISIGDTVEWKYGQGKAQGEVKEVHTDDVTKTIKDKEIKRKGSAEEPALVIQHEDGLVLKSASEVTKK